jgi:hypothetical protein
LQDKFLALKTLAARQMLSKSCFHTTKNFPGLIHGAAVRSAKTLRFDLLAAQFFLDFLKRNAALVFGRRPGA